MSWGLTIDEVHKHLRHKEWQRWDRLRGLLLQERPLPLRISLKAPTGRQALDDFSRFQSFISQWQSWSPASQVQWEQKNYQKLGCYQVPVAVEIPSVKALFEVLGTEAVARSKHWEWIVSQFLPVDKRLSAVVIKNLQNLETLPKIDIQAMANLLPQLQPGMGKGFYLRAIPVTGIDTKFIETHAGLISELLAVIHNDETIKNRLAEWLGCTEKPKGWLIVKPLCQSTRAQLLGLSELKLSTSALRETVLPGTHILVVENEESGYSLPELPNTIAIIGGGKNVAWMNSQWLASKSVGYWGDIDTWGLSILSDVRRYLPGVVALMMDRETVTQFPERMSAEGKPWPYALLPENLTPEEISLFNGLKSGDFENTRLEQERLSQDFIEKQLRLWCSSI